MNWFADYSLLVWNAFQIVELILNSFIRLLTTVLFIACFTIDIFEIHKLSTE